MWTYGLIQWAVFGYHSDQLKNNHFPFRFSASVLWHWLILLSSLLRWHRIAYSVEDKSVTLYLDCKKVQTLELMRGDGPVVSTEGVVVFGTRLLDEEVFEVNIKHLVLKLTIKNVNAVYRPLWKTQPTLVWTNKCLNKIYPTESKCQTNIFKILLYSCEKCSNFPNGHLISIF